MCVGEAMRAPSCYPAFSAHEVRLREIRTIPVILDYTTLNKAQPPTPLITATMVMGVDCSAACLSDVFEGILSRRLRVLIPLQDPSGAAISRSLQPSWSAQIKFLIGSRNVTITHPHLGETRSRPGATRLLGRCERGERVESTRQRTLLAR